MQCNTEINSRKNNNFNVTISGHTVDTIAPLSCG